MLLPFCSFGQTYFLKSTSTSWQLGNRILPLNSAELEQSGGGNYIGFSYVFPPVNYGQWTNVILTPKLYSSFYTVPSVADTVYFTSGASLISWFNANAVGGSGGTPSLSNNFIGVGNSSNLLSGSSGFTYDGDYLSISSNTGGGNVQIDYTLVNDIRTRVEPNKDGTYAMTSDLPIMGKYTNATPGAATTFTVSVTGGTSCVAISATPSVIVTTGCSISGATLTITCSAASIGGASISLNYIYYNY